MIGMGDQLEVFALRDDDRTGVPHRHRRFEPEVGDVVVVADVPLRRRV